MGRIRRLDDHLATLIAAGELVAETGSVVRELVDNALEALNLLDDRQRRLSEKKRSAVSRRPSVTDS